MPTPHKPASNKTVITSYSIHYTKLYEDSLQTNNLIDNVNPYVTAPEINLILVRQSFEEALHSQSYAVMVDSISQNSAEIYELWRRDMMLKSKNDAIAAVYERLAVEP